MLFFRSLCFFLLLVLWTFFICTIGSITFLTFNQKIISGVGYYWAVGIDLALRYICRVKVKILGKENLPKEGGFIIASKHQSAWETIYFLKLFYNPIAILKKELFYIPFYGWYLPLMGMIIIDRKAGRGAIKQIIKGIKRAEIQKRGVVIFPEGTRTKPNESTPFKSGIALIHKALPNVPIVPIALNSGLIWPAKSFIIKPGVITLKILKPTNKLMTKEDLLQNLQKSIDFESNLLCKQ